MFGKNCVTVHTGQNERKIKERKELCSFNHIAEPMKSTKAMTLEREKEKKLEQKFHWGKLNELMCIGFLAFYSSAMLIFITATLVIRIRKKNCTFIHIDVGIVNIVSSNFIVIFPSFSHCSQMAILSACYFVT